MNAHAMLRSLDVIQSDSIVCGRTWSQVCRRIRRSVLTASPPMSSTCSAGSASSARSTWHQIAGSCRRLSVRQHDGRGRPPRYGWLLYGRWMPPERRGLSGADPGRNRLVREHIPQVQGAAAQEVLRCAGYRAELVRGRRRARRPAPPAPLVRPGLRARRTAAGRAAAFAAGSRAVYRRGALFLVLAQAAGRSGRAGPLALRPRGPARRLPRPGPPGRPVRRGRRAHG